MSQFLIYMIGFTAQLLFSARLIIQWLSSEKNKKTTTPASFWVHSLAASFLLFTYGYLRQDFPIMLGQIITYYIYIRNLQIDHRWQHHSTLFRCSLMLFPLLVLVYFFNNQRYDITTLFGKVNMPAWLFITGVVGQVVFTGRFVYQWLYAEKHQQAILPFGFWLLSLAGAAMILTYAILRSDPVLIVGQAFGFLVYTRNIFLSRHHEG